jgi:hypothetical protein
MRAVANLKQNFNHSIKPIISFKQFAAEKSNLYIKRRLENPYGCGQHRGFPVISKFNKPVLVPNT